MYCVAAAFEKSRRAIPNRVALQLYAPMNPGSRGMRYRAGCRLILQFLAHGLPLPGECACALAWFEGVHNRPALGIGNGDAFADLRNPLEQRFPMCDRRLGA